MLVVPANETFPLKMLLPTRLDAPVPETIKILPVLPIAPKVLFELSVTAPATVTAPVNVFPVKPELIVKFPPPVVVNTLSNVLVLPVIVTLPPKETAPTKLFLEPRDDAPVPATVNVPLNVVAVDAPV